MKHMSRTESSNSSTFNNEDYGLEARKFKTEISKNSYKIKDKIFYSSGIINNIMKIVPMLIDKWKDKYI